MNALEHLRAARALIDTPEKWTQDDYAKRGTVRCDYDDKTATCFCAIGALLNVAHAGLHIVKDDNAAFQCLKNAVPGNGDLVLFNDAEDRTHAEVLALYDAAIATAEADKL